MIIRVLPATDYVEDDVDLNTHLIKNAPSTFLIKVQGKSMNSIGIHDGDLLVVDRSLNPKNFSTIIANVNEELVVKTFVKKKDQSFLTSGSKKLKDKILNSRNPDMTQRQLSKQERKRTETIKTC